MQIESTVQDGDTVIKKMNASNVIHLVIKLQLLYKSVWDDALDNTIRASWRQYFVLQQTKQNENILWWLRTDYNLSCNGVNHVWMKCFIFFILTMKRWFHFKLHLHCSALRFREAKWATCSQQQVKICFIFDSPEWFLDCIKITGSAQEEKYITCNCVMFLILPC